MSFPTVIDNTMRKAFVSCPESFNRRFVECIQPIAPPSVDLHFGACFAKAMESARKAFYFEPRVGQAEAIEEGVEAGVAAWGAFQGPAASNKSLPRLIGAIRYYFQQWPLGEDGLEALGVECSFAIELPIMHPDRLPTHDGVQRNIKYAGRYDMLAKDSNGRLYVVDEKTTSRLGDSWIAQWDLDSQMTGYIWSVKNQLENKNAEVMAQIRGVSILRNDYGHAECNIVRSAHMLDQWYDQLVWDVYRMVAAYNFQRFDKALSSACTAYGRPCDYAMLCKSADPTRLIDGNYHRVVWNPVAEEK
jgi:hypothetical protein